MKKLFFVLFSLFLYVATNAQSLPPFCGSDELERLIIEQDPSYLARKASNESHLQRYIANHKGQERESITIPVVFHVVHSNEAIVNSITSAVLQSQIDILNRDFSRQNYDVNYLPSAFLARSVDTEIRFCLARQTPDGAASTGIVRKFGSSADAYYIMGNDTDDGKSVKGSVKGSPAWDNTRYLNILICDIKDSDLADGILGFAYRPSQISAGATWVYGVVLDYRHTGLSTVNPSTKLKVERNMGRTLTHEVGHYLDLLHLWGSIDGENGGDDLCSDDDFCLDTPIQKNPNYGVPSFPTLSSCPGEDAFIGTMFMNYMDYPDDKVLIAFTSYQKERMHAAIDLYRPGLKTSQGCTFGTSARGCSVLSEQLGIYAETVQNNAAVVHWVKSKSSTYEVWYKAQSSSNWTVASSLTDNKYTISGISAAEPYQVKVKHFICPTYSPFTSTISVQATAIQNTSIPSPPDASNNSTSPTLIALNTGGNATINQTINTSTDMDWYTVTTTNAKPNIKITLTNLPQDYDMRVFKNGATSPVDDPDTPLNPLVMPEITKHNTTGQATYTIQIKGFHPEDFTPNYMYQLKVETSGTPFAKTDQQEYIQNTENPTLLLYPNPTNGYLNIPFDTKENEIAQIQIINLLGEMAYATQIDTEIGENLFTIDLSELRKGLYWVKLVSPSHSTLSKLIIKQ